MNFFLCFLQILKAYCLYFDGYKGGAYVSQWILLGPWLCDLDGVSPKTTLFSSISKANKIFCISSCEKSVVSCYSGVVFRFFLEILNSAF